MAEVPYDIIRTHKAVTLLFDLMFVNKICFRITVSRKMRFGTTERLPSRHADIVSAALTRVIKFYWQRGFQIKECNGDGEFESLRADIAENRAVLNIASEGEHVPEIERYIRTVKERASAIHNTVVHSRSCRS